MGLFDKGSLAKIGGSLFGPTGAGVGYLFGNGQTGNPNAVYQPTSGVFRGNEGSPTDNPNAELIAQLQAKIQGAAGQGSYGEGAISTAVNEFNNLKQKLAAGQIDQKTYVEAGNAILPGVMSYAQQVMGSGSRAADAAKNAGAMNLFNNIGRDYNIYKSGQEILGRDINANELAQLTPLFGSGSEKELESGRAALAQVAEQEKNSPEAVQKRLKENSGQFYGQVGDVFQNLLKRGASQEELDHFGKLLASGDVDAYELNQFVSQMPEYREGQDKTFREGLNTELESYDRDYFGKAKEDVLNRYAQAGIQNSSSLDFALTNLMGDIAKERSKYLAGVSADQYKGNKDLARSDYQINLERLYGNQDYSRNRNDQLSDLLRGRSYDVADYNTQRNDLMSMLGQQQNQRRSGGLGSSLGTLLGAGIGASYGNPQAGAYIGGAGGGLYDYWNQR